MQYGDATVRHQAAECLAQACRHDVDIRNIAAARLGMACCPEAKQLLVEIMRTSTLEYERIDAALSFLKIQSGKFL